MLVWVLMWVAEGGEECPVRKSYCDASWEWVVCVSRLYLCSPTLGPTEPTFVGTNDQPILPGPRASVF